MKFKPKENELFVEADTGGVNCTIEGSSNWPQALYITFPSNDFWWRVSKRKSKGDIQIVLFPFKPHKYLTSRGMADEETRKTIDIIEKDRHILAEGSCKKKKVNKIYETRP